MQNHEERNRSIRCGVAKERHKPQLQLGTRDDHLRENFFPS